MKFFQAQQTRFRRCVSRPIIFFVCLLPGVLAAQLSEEEIQDIVERNKKIAATYAPLSVVDKLSNYLKNDFVLDSGLPAEKKRPGDNRYRSKIVSAVSVDGIRFERTQGIISKRGSFPTLVFGDANVLICYYQTDRTEKGKSYIVAAVSEDNGRSWYNKSLVINNIPKHKTPSSPYAVRLKNGMTRLYFIMRAHFKDGTGNRLYYADSRDGFTFYLRGTAFGSSMRRPANYSVVRMPNRWTMFVRTTGNVRNYIASSSDGRFFIPYQRRNFSVNGVNARVHSGLMGNDYFRIYVFAPGKRQIRSYYTENFKQWIDDGFFRLNSSKKLFDEDGTVGFPSVVPMTYDDDVKFFFMAFTVGTR